MTETAQAGRHRAAGDDVPRARRHLSRRRQPAHHARAEADRAAGRAAHQPFRHRGTGQAARRRRHAGLRPDRAAAYRLSCSASAGLAASHSFKADKWADVQPDFETAHFLNGFAPCRRQVPLPAGLDRARRRRTGRRRAWVCPGPGRCAAGISRSCRPDRGGRRTRIRSAWPPRRRASFLNSTFTETPTSRAREGRPELLHPSRRCRPRSASPTATGSRSATAAARSCCTPKLFDGLKPRRGDRRRHLAQRRA